MTLSTDRDVWWDKPLRVLQFNFEDRLGLYVSRITGKSVVEVAEKIGANVIVVFARDVWGYTYYRGGKAGPPRPGMKGDFLRELVDEAHRRGIRVIAMVAHTANKLLYMKHSDWAQVNNRGELILLEHAPSLSEWEPQWPQLCINSPFLDHAVLEVREALEVGVDGVLFDSFRYQPDPERACYCRWCRQRFREELGHDMPVKPDWNNSVWRALWDWRYKVVVEALNRLAEEAKRSGRKIMVLYNSHPAGWAGRANRVVEEARGILDGVFAECSEADYQPPGFIAEMVKLTKAMAGDGIKVFASRNAFHQLKPTEPVPAPALRQGLRETIIAGGDPWVLVFSSQFVLDDSWIEAVKQVFREHELLEEYIVGSEPVRYAAIVVSNKVRDHYGRLNPSLYVDETRGFYYMLQRLHVPVQYLLDRDLKNNVWNYKVVILADTACISSDTVEALKKFRDRENGGILATYMAGMMDGECLPAGGNLLADTLGFELVGEPIELEWAYLNPIDTRHPLLKGLDKPILIGDTRRNMRQPLNLASIVPVRPTEGSEAPASMLMPAYRYGHEYTLGRSSPPPSYEARIAGIVAGVGTVYYPWRLGANYWYSGSPRLLRLLANTIDFLAGEPPVKVKAPYTVISEAWRQGDRIIVHLLNYTTDQRILAADFTGARQPLPAYSGGPPIHPITEIIPVHGIVVSIDTRLLGYENVKAYSPLTSHEYTVVVDKNYVNVNVEKLEEYEVIVVEPKR